MRNITSKFTSIVALIVIFFGATTIITSAETLPDFMIMTEPWTPWQFEENGNVKGIAVDLLVLMLERVGSGQNHDDIKMYPWARGYMTVQRKENTILFSTTRTKKREKMFKWVGPIFQNSSYLIAKKDKHIKIKSLKELKNYNIGTVIDDVGEEYMNKLGIGIDQLDRTTSNFRNIEKLNFNRIDMIVQSWEGFCYDAKELNINPNLFETVYLADVKDISYAFYKGTPDWIIKKFQKALDELKEEGKLDELIKRYKKI